MTVLANGKRHELADGTTISGLLSVLALVPERVIIEHNGMPLPRERYAATTLCEGDRLEIAQMVGGG